MENSLTPNKETNDRTETVIYAVYYLMLLAMLAASFYPAYRVWGFNHWAYYPSYVAIALFCVGAVLPFAFSKFRFGRGVEDADAGKRKSKFLTVAGILIIVYVAMFYLLRAESHFLGDGASLLGNLPAVNPWVKVRNLGEELIHKYLYLALSGSESSRALLSFQLVSYLSGIITLIIVAFASTRLFERFRDRLMFFLGLGSSGYMLLFFGYVENYSVFVTAVITYALFGLLAATGKMSRWYILIPLLVAIFMHVFGVILLPSAIFILMAGTTPGDFVSRLSGRVKYISVAAVLVIFGGASLYFYHNEYFFRFAMVPIKENRFTIENYTLLSLNHILDVLNLQLVLFPAIAVMIVTMMFLPLKKLFSNRGSIFLSVLAVCGLSAVFLFDPKLGMPRDWDLFSFSGVALVILGYYTTIKHRPASRFYTMVVVMSIFLGFVVLVPRAVGRSLGSIELMHVEDYFRLDTKKNIYHYFPVQEYYESHGQREKAQAIYARWDRICPEWQHNRRGMELEKRERYAEAVPHFRRAIELNAMFSLAYSNLASCYLALRQLDSAQVYLTIANGLNPNSAHTLTKLAYLHWWEKDYDLAEKYFKRSIESEGDLITCMGLLGLYSQTKQTGKHGALLIEIASRPDAPPTIHKKLGDLYMSQNLVEQASTQYRTALRKGLDSTQAEALRARFPQLSL